MTWKARHQGSPQAVEGLTFDQVAEGLADGRWAPTDEVMGADETEWTSIEDHPQFLELAAEVEEEPSRTYDDETSLDMNALIDVTLVLLIFFIIISSYAALQKRLEAPKLTADGAGPAVVTEEQVAQTMVHVKLNMSEGKPVYTVEGKTLDASKLKEELTQFLSPGKTQLLLEHDPAVPHGAVVQLQDAAKGVGMTRVLLLIPEEELASGGNGR